MMFNVCLCIQIKMSWSRLSQCLLVLQRLCLWLSGGEELCVWSEDFRLQCQRQNHSDTGRTNKREPNHCRNAQFVNAAFVFWCSVGITALIELPSNCTAAAMDKEIGGRNDFLFTACLAQIKENNGFKEFLFLFLCSDLQSGCLWWFLCLTGWNSLSVWPPGPDPGSYQRKRSAE